MLIACRLAEPAPCIVLQFRFHFEILSHDRGLQNGLMGDVKCRISARGTVLLNRETAHHVQVGRHAAHNSAVLKETPGYKFSFCVAMHTWSQ